MGPPAVPHGLGLRRCPPQLPGAPSSRPGPSEAHGQHPAQPERLPGRPPGPRVCPLCTAPPAPAAAAPFLRRGGHLPSARDAPSPHGPPHGPLYPAQRCRGSSPCPGTRRPVLPAPAAPADVTAADRVRVSLPLDCELLAGRDVCRSVSRHLAQCLALRCPINVCSTEPRPQPSSFIV